MTGKLSTIPDFIFLPHSKLTNNFGLHNENGEAVIIWHGCIREQTEGRLDYIQLIPLAQKESL